MEHADGRWQIEEIRLAVQGYQAHVFAPSKTLTPKPFAGAVMQTEARSNNHVRPSWCPAPKPLAERSREVCRQARDAFPKPKRRKLVPLAPEYPCHQVVLAAEHSHHLSFYCATTSAANATRGCQIPGDTRAMWFIRGRQSSVPTKWSSNNFGLTVVCAHNGCLLHVHMWN